MVVKFSGETWIERLARWLQSEPQAQHGAVAAPQFRWTRLVQIFAASILTAALVILINLSLVTIRTAGCQTVFYRNTIPRGVTPGLWQIRGIETARATDWFGAVQQSLTWESEWFRVVE